MATRPPCGPCAAAAARRRNEQLLYVWTSGDGQTTVEYDSVMAAKAKVLRKGGTYTVTTKGA